MRTQFVLRSALCAAAFAFLLGAAAPRAVHRHGWLSKAVRSGSGILYVASASDTTVTLYDAGSTDPNPQPLGFIVQGVTNPTAVAVDPAGNLYVANAARGSAGANVELYPQGALQPSVTYTTGITAPAGLAIGPNGTLYVANATGAPFTGPSIEAFPSGSVHPARFASDPNAQTANAISVDASGNVYLAYTSFLCCPASAVDEFLVGDKTPQLLAIAGPAQGGGFAQVLGLALDPSGNLLTAGASVVDVNAPSAQSWPATVPPAAVIGAGRPQSAVALSADGTRLFVADVRDSQIDAYAYPGGQLLEVYANLVDSPAGIAVSPAATLAARSPQPPPPPAQPHLGRATAYESVASATMNAIEIFDARTGAPDGSPLELPFSAPVGLAVDPKRHLFVAANDAIFEYSKGLSPKKDIAHGVDATYTVAVGNDGTLAFDVEGHTIAINPGGNAREQILVKHLGGVVVGLTIDSADDIYYEYSLNCHTKIAELVKGPSGYAPPVQLPLTGTTLQGPPATSLAIDSTGDFVVGVENGVGVFLPGATAPQFVIGSTVPICGNRFALDATEHFIFANDCRGNIWIFRYPSGTPYAAYPDPGASVPGASEEGFAVAPAAPPGPPWPASMRRRRGR